MPPIDLDMAHGVHNYIRAKGIELYLGQTCTAMDKEGVILKDGRKVKADMVILSADPLKTASDKIAAIKILATIKDGMVVYQQSL